jgi:hypothetical protein
MIFKKVNLEYYSFTEEDREDIQLLLRKGLRKTKDKLLSLRQQRAGGGVSSEVTSDEGGSLLDPDGFLPRPHDKPALYPSESGRSTTERDFADHASNQ